MAARYAASLPLLLRTAGRLGVPDLQAGTAKRASQARILDLSDDSRPDSYLGDGVCRAAGAGLWQLSERVPEPLAGRRKHRHAAIALPQVRAGAHVVGKCSAGELGGACGAGAAAAGHGSAWRYVVVEAAGGRALGTGRVAIAPLPDLGAPTSQSEILSGPDCVDC